MSTPVRTSEAPQTAARPPSLPEPPPRSRTAPTTSRRRPRTATECQSSPGHDGKWWSYRIVGFSAMPVPGRPGRSKDLLQCCRSAPAHGSEPNRSDDRRIGFAIRYIPTRLKQAVGQRDWATAGQLEDVDGMKRRGIVLAFLMRLKQICNHPSQWLGDGAWRFRTRARPRRSRAAANQEPSQPMSSGSE